jgi:molybdopterin synthase catalytic subunit
VRVRLLAFASAADALGRGELELELPEGSRVGDLRALLERRHPALGALWSRLAVAVDGEVAAAEAPLGEGCEVALLPPVSGGGLDADRVLADRVRLTEAPLDPRQVEAAVAEPASGATVVFVGTVRDHLQSRAVAGIAYSAYRTMAETVLRRIARDLEAARPGLRVAIHHRLGELAVGEASVVIAVSAPHREAAYAASREALERLKREAPIWKHERYADGGVAWREEEKLGQPSPAAAGPPSTTASERTQAR